VVESPGVADASKKALAPLLRFASGALLVLAVVLGYLAFHQFDPGESPQPGSPDFRTFHDQQLRDARTSVLLGLGTAFSLFGCFACYQTAQRLRNPQPPTDPSPPPPP
jgi:hypothetical protein